MIDELHWQQYCLSARWQEIKKKAKQKHILLFGDVPIFVAHDSVDVWVCPERYLLDENGNMTVNTGVPPDYFSDTGQSWGNPHYNWDMMAQENFSWWIQRLRYHFELFDLVRIDHFRGLEAVWMINAEAENAVDGFYQKVPGDALLKAVEQGTGQLPIVAEDLGIITEEVVALRKKFHLPGMSVLQFGFDEHDDNPHKVKNILPDSVVYTGTHDNETALGWYLNLDACMREKVMDSLYVSYQHSDESHDCESSADYQDKADKVVDQMMIAALQSQASLCVFPLQDCLHLDNSAKMNTPGTIENNWCWQFDWQQISAELSEQFKLWIKHSQRQLVTDGNSKIK
jgi:4-alpha-glucanotransferase